MFIYISIVSLKDVSGRVGRVGGEVRCMCALYIACCVACCCVCSTDGKSDVESFIVTKSFVVMVAVGRSGIRGRYG